MDAKNIKSGFQLLATSIKTIDFINNFTYFTESEEIERNFDVTYEVDDISYDDDENTIMGTISLNVIAIVKNKESEMKFNLIIQGCFISEEDIKAEDFRNMLELNGCATLYSIARAIVLNISSQACYGAHILLPMINLFKLKDKKEVKEEDLKDKQ